MALTVEIDSADHTDEVDRPPGGGAIRISMSMGNAWECSLVTQDNDSTVSAYRAAIDESLAVLSGPTDVLFFGMINQVRDLPKAESGVGTLTEVVARSFGARADTIIVNETFAAGETFETVVTTLHTNYLAGLGIDLDTLATGPTLEAQTFVDITLREVFNHLSTITGYIWRIAPLFGTFGELQFFAPGDKTAPYSLTAANMLSVGPITWEQSRNQYFNTVTVRYGGPVVVNKTDTFTGTAAAGEVNFDLTYPALLNAGGEAISQGYVSESGSGDLPINGAVWSFDAANNRIVRVSDLGNGVTATFNYSVQFPLTVTVEDSGEIATNGIYATVIDEPGIFDLDAATEAANGYLRRFLVAPKVVTISTRRQELVMPGDTITLTFTNRTLSGDYLITSVDATDVTLDHTLEYRLTCVSGDEPQALFRDIVRQSLTGGAGRSTGSASGGVIPTSSGRFDEDVVAWAGTAQKEVIIGDIAGETVYVGGPGILMNRNPNTGAGRGSWAMIADQPSGAQALWFQDRSVTGLGSYTFRFYRVSTNEYALHGFTGVTLHLGSSSNRLGGVYPTALELAGPERIVSSGLLVPPQITGNQNNYNPTGLSTCKILALNTDASRDITGFTATSAGHLILVSNVGSQSIVLRNQSGSSSVGNKMVCPGNTDLTLHLGDQTWMWYDGASTIWRVTGF